MVCVCWKYLGKPVWFSIFLLPPSGCKIIIIVYSMDVMGYVQSQNLMWQLYSPCASTNVYIVITVTTQATRLQLSLSKANTPVGVSNQSPWSLSGKQNNVRSKQKWRSKLCIWKLHSQYYLSAHCCEWKEQYGGGKDKTSLNNMLVCGINIQACLFAHVH